MRRISGMKRLRLLILAALGLFASLAIVACGGSGGIDEGADTSDVTTAAGDQRTDSLTISNWPLYIDDRTIPEFQRETGINTTYIQDINDNNQFFGKVQAQLSQGDSGGRDIMIVTDWMAEKMWNLGYLQRLDHEYLETVFNNMLPSLKSPSFDPDREYTVPWQSGMTGLVVREDLAPNVKSINDLFDPQYKGKVTLLEEMRDTVPLVMAADGIDPAEATVDDWMAAIDKIDENVQNGQIRRFTGNDFVQDMIKGDVVAAIGWSGDTVQVETDNPNIKYVQPAEGCSLWSDNMVIPVGAPSPGDAYEFMNYVYEPENQAQITEYVNYVSPVQGVREILLQRDPQIGENQLIFPSDEFTENCFDQSALPGDEAEQQEIEQAFQDVVNR